MRQFLAILLAIVSVPGSVQGFVSPTCCCAATATATAGAEDVIETPTPVHACCAGKAATRNEDDSSGQPCPTDDDRRTDPIGDCDCQMPCCNNSMPAALVEMPIRLVGSFRTIEPVASTSQLPGTPHMRGLIRPPRDVTAT